MFTSASGTIFRCHESRIDGYGTPTPIDRSGSRFEFAPLIRYRQRTHETGAAYHRRRRRRPGHSPETKGGRRGGDVRVDGRAGRGGREAVHWVEHGGGGGGDAGEVGQVGEAS